MQASAVTTRPHPSRAPRVGVLMVNLGTPDAPDRKSVRRYLKEFLWDPRVVEGPRLPWWLALNLVVLNTRPARSARAYASVWTEHGSPLLAISKRQFHAVRQCLAERCGDEVTVRLAMRYGNPSIRDGLRSMADEGMTRLLIVPMYPQYSATTTASVFDAVVAELKTWRRLPELRFAGPWHDHPGYVEALAASVREHRAAHGEADVLLMSFHGIPREYFDRGDPYYCYCRKTARLLAEALGLDDERCRVAFQSRFGPRKWLEPYTDETLKSLPETGVRAVQVICPGFSADCLETLEEIAVENRKAFLDSGGERYEYIPCLNDRADHVRFLADFIETHTAGWRDHGRAAHERAVSPAAP